MPGGLFSSKAMLEFDTKEMNIFITDLPPEDFSIIDQDDQTRLIKNICKSENIDIKKLSPNYVLTIINSWKNKGLYPEKVIPSKKNIFEKGILKIYKIYQSKLLDLNACDFGDLILHCVNIFENNNDIISKCIPIIKYLYIYFLK